jgi:hypothetical protein
MATNDRGDFINLLRQLTSRRDHEHKGTLPTPGMTKTIERGKKKGGGLASTSLCGRHNVTATQNGWDGLCLHR